MSNWRRPTGRPHQTWLETIAKDMHQRSTSNGGYSWSSVILAMWAAINLDISLNGYSSSLTHSISQQDPNYIIHCKLDSVHGSNNLEPCSYMAMINTATLTRDTA